MSLIEKFIHNIYSKNLFTTKDRLLIATSGGIDSVVLCKLCSLGGFDFGIAHCNFQLRGSDSERDEAFVKKFAEELGVAFYSEKFDTREFAKQQKYSIQEAARKLRYDWFKKIAAENSYHYILTAHHADDNIETLVMRFFRGSGIKGLTGIREKNSNIIRPLLFARRMELEDFLQEHGMAYVVDETNLEDHYARNYIRNQVLPMLSQVFQEVNDNLLNNIKRLAEAEMLYRQSINHQKKKLLTRQGESLYLPVLLLQQNPAARTLLFEIISEYNFSAGQLPDAWALLESESGRYVASATHRILRNRKHLIISPLKEKEGSLVVIETTGKYNYGNGALIVEKLENNKDWQVSSDVSEACLDASKVHFPLMLRPWQIGDYFYPLGMAKKKKLSRFFIDQKLSIPEKEKVWVVEMDKRIIWVVGQRIDDRFKITGTTSEIIQIKTIDI